MKKLGENKKLISFDFWQKFGKALLGGESNIVDVDACIHDSFKSNC